MSEEEDYSIVGTVGSLFWLGLIFYSPAIAGAAILVGVLVVAGLAYLLFKR